LTASARQADGRGLVWILHTTGYGANQQLRYLAATTAATVAIKDTLDAPLRALVDRLWPPAAWRIPARKQAVLKPPWPDLVLFGGGRSLVDALRIRRASGGHSRLVCVGRPATRLDRLDLVLTTPQYRLPRHRRVLHLALPFQRPPGRAGGATSPDARFAMLPRPWFAVLLGGDSGSFRFPLKQAEQLCRGLDDLIARHGGSVLATTSPRTPAEVADLFEQDLDNRGFFYRWRSQDQANPLESMMTNADAFVVTADSASMLAEACATGRPVASVALARRWRERLTEHRLLPAWPPGLRRTVDRLRDRATAAGCWVPARSMHRIHRQLHQYGLVCDLKDLTPDRATPSAVHAQWDQAAKVLNGLLTQALANPG